MKVGHCQALILNKSSTVSVEDFFCLYFKFGYTHVVLLEFAMDIDQHAARLDISNKYKNIFISYF